MFKLLYFVHGRWIGYIMPQLMRVFCEKVVMLYLQKNQGLIEAARQKCISENPEANPDYVCYDKEGPNGLILTTAMIDVLGDNGHVAAMYVLADAALADYVNLYSQMVKVTEEMNKMASQMKGYIALLRSTKDLDSERYVAMSR